MMTEDISHGSILIVDDDAANRDILCQYLTHVGFTTCSAADGQQAMALTSTQHFDLVLLDIGMPVLDGIVVLQTLRRLYTVTELPIIMVTGRSGSTDIVQALQLGANDYVTKPFDLPVVLARMRCQLSRKCTEEALRQSEERYALAMRGANDGLWDWDVHRNAIYFSPRWKVMLGYTEEEIGTSTEEWFTRVHPDDLDRLQAGLHNHLNDLTPHFECEYRMLHKNGNHHWMLSRGLAVRDVAGRAWRMAGSLTDITESKVFDPLTGLPNRLLFLDHLGQALARTKRLPEYRFAVLFIDLNRFKMINDSFGHRAGDELLDIMARRLERCLCPDDAVEGRVGAHTVARFGSDEFAVLLADIKEVSDATRAATHIHTELSRPCTLNGHEVFPSASIGIALGTAHVDCTEELLRDAGIALHRAKTDGSAPYAVFDQSMHTSTVARLRLETDLRRAIDHEEFRVYYQPLVSLTPGRIIGFEALARWWHPHRGCLSPLEFIPMAEKLRLIIPIGMQVLRTACQQTRAWQKHLPTYPFLLVSVNLSGIQFTQPDLVELISRTLQEVDLAPRSVKLEITESVLMDNVDAAMSILTRLHTLGVKLGLDDFGTGYSSLSCLHRYPFDVLKLDRSFVQRLGTDAESTEIVRTIITLAHNLGLEVIAEGIETPEQLTSLKTLGCEYGQGYLFSRPVDAETATALLTTAPQW